MRAQEFVFEKVIATFKTGNIMLNVDDHTIERTYQRNVNPNNIDRAIRKLKRIESQLETLEVGQTSWVDDPDSGISLGIRRLMKPGHYLFSTVVGKRTYDSDVPVFTLPSGELTQEEQLQELAFLGSQCTKDCSGHRAGYQWYKRKQYDPESRSPSFNKGAALAKAGK
jgi:hypothetical protein